MDKFGNPLYDKTWEEMCRNAKILGRMGYKEAKNKPNLFYLKTEDGIYYADMRDTEIVPIWGDSWPLFYWRFSQYVPDWKKRRLVKREMYRSAANGCRCRLSFHQECEPGGLMFDPDDDGYCNYCGKDFQGSGSYCSEQCRKTALRESESARKLLQPTCIWCGERMDYDAVIRHHVSYEPEITVRVCRSCHGKIHNPHRHYPKPPEGESKDFYARRKGVASSWKERTEVYTELFKKGHDDIYIAEVIGVTPETVRRRRLRWNEEVRSKGKIKCSSCGEVFDPLYRTTCPRCRAFFR